MRHIELLAVVLLAVICGSHQVAARLAEFKDFTADNGVTETTAESSGTSSSLTTSDNNYQSTTLVESDDLILKKKVYNGRIAGAVFGGLFLGVVITLTVVVLLHHFVFSKRNDDKDPSPQSSKPHEETQMSEYDTVWSAAPATRKPAPERKDVAAAHVYGNVSGAANPRPSREDAGNEYQAITPHSQAAGATNEGFQDQHVYAKLSD